MDAIKAFVGHSFAEDDGAVVRSILALLDQIKRLRPGFTWEDAKGPEPQLIPEKVRERFADKNLFIGICTRREHAIDDGALSKFWMFPSKRLADAKKFAWKTSDWLIQEIGVAVGRGVKIILLVEEDMRLPGAIQGSDLEVIFFRRGEPQKCAESLMAMIASLSPPPTKIEQAPPGANTAAPETESVEPAMPGGGWENPRPDWNKEDYDQALFFAIAGREDPIVERITAAFLASPLGETEESRRKWRAGVEFGRIAFGQGGSLEKLREIADSTPPIGSVLAQLARAYRKYGEPASSLAAFERALDAEPDIHQRIRYLGEAAVEAREARQGGEKIAEMLERIRQLGSGTHNAERAVLRAEQVFAEKFSDKNVSLGLLERLLELEPGDVDSRFKLAYAYGDLGMEDLAVYHYTKIPHAERGGTAWNNLGVALGELGIPGRAVSALRESEQRGETLAMSNLANRFSDAGFFDEASAILNHAATIPDHHRNVDTALANLKDAPDQEQKRVDKISEKATQVSAFYRHFGRALGLPGPEQLATLWTCIQYGALSLSIRGDAIKFLGEYEVDMSGGLGNLAMGTLYNLGGPARKETYKIEFTGTLHGQAVVGQVRRTKSGASAPVSLFDDNALTVLMWIHDDSSKISIMEREGKGEPRFYEFARAT